jgi:hypothetical protein
LELSNRTKGDGELVEMLLVIITVIEVGVAFYFLIRDRIGEHVDR